jgi:hypothetical protein
MSKFIELLFFSSEIHHTYFNRSLNFESENCLKENYNSLLKLIDRMTALRKNLRPSCEEILNEYGSWSVNSSCLSLNTIDGRKTIEECFHEYFLSKKIQK